MKKYIFLLLGFFQIFCLVNVVNAQTVTPAPTFSPDPNGYWEAPQVVTITAPGSTIYYTTDGSIPTTALTGYASPAQVTLTLTVGPKVRAIAVKSGMSPSAISEATFRLVTAPPAPTNAQMRLTSNCVWEATWTRGAMSYFVKDSLGTEHNVSSPNAFLMTCPTGNPEGKKPISVRACHYSACSAPTTFTVVGVDAPVISHTDETYSSAQNVTITAPDATIYYTTNNTTPTTSSSVYSGPIAVSTNTTIRAIAVKFGIAKSSESSVNLSFPSPSPTFSPDPNGYWPSPQVVTITAPGSTIYYTTDGSTPTTALTGYASPAQVTLTLTVGPTVRAIAVKPGMSPSILSEATFRLVTAPPAPTNAQIRLTQDCVWEATWSPVSGAMHYYVTDTQDESYVSAPFSSTTVACPAGNPNGRKPISVRACHYSACSASTAFSVIASGGALPVTIQAENYTSMSGVQAQETTDVGGGHNVGYLDNGDWMSYANSSVNIPVTGMYKITYRVASPSGGGVLALKKASDDSLIDTVSIPSTGAFQAWVDVERNVALKRGQNTFKLYVNARGSGININWFRIESIPPTTFPVVTSATLTSPVNAATVSLTSPNPCFQWNTDVFASAYSVYVSNTNDFAAQRWVKTVPVGTTQVCWNGGSGWAREGLFSAELPTNLTLATPHFWQVVSTTLNGLGYSEIRSFTPSNLPPVNTQFDFNAQAPSDFQHNLSSLNIPNLTNLVPVAITQGSTDVNNGALGYKVAIEPPPGINNHAPSLAISYNSRGGNGIAGVGWSLSGLSAISRCLPTVATSNTGVSDPYTNKDDLCLDGQRLVVKGHTDNAHISRASYWASGTSYVTEQANFTEITSQGYGVFSGEPDSFIAKTKDGKTLYFGEANRNAKVFAADNASKGTKSWHLTRVGDRYGNEYTVDYNYDTISGEHLPSRIVYAPGAAVVFKYVQRLGQIPWGSKDGKKFRQPNVLKSIDTYINVTNPQFPENGTPVRRYNLEYKLSPSTERDLVSTIQECGRVSTQWNCAKPLEFNYELGSFVAQEFPSPEGVYGGGRVGDYPQYTDIDGDEYNDALMDNGTVVWGQANGQFSFEGWVADFENYTSVWEYQVAPMRTEDGTVIVVRRITSAAPDSSRPWEEVPNTQSISIIHHITRTSQVVSKLNFSTGLDDSHKIGAFTIGDFDCDGLDDMYYRGKIYTQAVNKKPWTWVLDNSGTYAQNSSTYMASTAGPCSVKKPVLTTNKRSKVDGIYNVINPLMADLNGDGNKELISHQPNTLKKVYRVGGDGFVMEEEQELAGALATNLPNKDCFSFTYDLDEDGREDIFGVSPASVFSAYLARDNSGWQAYLSAPISLSYLASNSNIVDSCSANIDIRPSDILVGDINSDGRPDLSHLNGFTSYPKKSDMLVQVTNGFGAETLVTHSTLSKDVYTPASVKPKFPYAPASRGTWVVKSVATTNGKGGYNTQSYGYKGALTHLQGRGFLGFEQITVTDSAKELVSVTDYHQQWPQTGRVSQQVLKDTSGKLISVQDTSYATLEGNGFFVYPHTQIKKSYGLLSHSIGSPVSTQVNESSIDACGNPQWQTQRVGKNFSNGFFDVELSRVDTEYLLNAGQANTCTDDFISRTNVSYTAGGETRLIKTEFEKNAQGDIERRTDYQGTALEKVTVIDRTAQGVTQGITESAKDIDSTAAAPRATSFSNFEENAWPRTVTNALNQSSTFTYDRRFGTVATETNSFVNTTTHYDELGRVDFIKTKDNTLTENISFYCVNNSAITCPNGAVYGVATRITNPNAAGYLGAPLSIVFYDVLQRKVQAAVYGFDGNVTNKSIQYMANGRVARVSEPFLTNGIRADITGSVWTTYSGYDAMGRAATVTPAAGGSVSTTYSLSGAGVLTRVATQVTSASDTQTQIRETDTNALGQVTRAVDAIGGWVDYTYDAQGNLKTTLINNNSLTQVTLTHDIAGNKTFISDPDAKNIQFEYNGFGELRRQTWQPSLSIQKKTLTFNYDLLGRKTQRVDNGPGLSGTYNWTYDQNNQPGMLTGRSGGGLVDTYHYDSYGRLDSTSHTTDGKTYNLGYAYDNFSRLIQSTSLGGFKAIREYSAQGYQVRTLGNMYQDTQVLWALGKQQDNRGQFTHQLRGNGVVTQQTFAAESGMPTQMRSGRLSGTSTVTNLSGDVQNLSYQYDSIGNLRYRESKRTDMNGTPLESLTETLTYDALNRLDISTGTGTYRRNYDYDTLGNLTFREDKENSSSANRDLGVLAYENVRNAGPHAVTSAGGQNYSYDLYGNMTKRGDTETITYDIFNKPTRIVGTATSDFYYDADHQLYKQVVDGVATVYLGNVEVIREGLTTTVNTYVDGAQHRAFNNGVNAGGYEYFYLHRDSLGSIEAISGRLGSFQSRMNFDAWGNRQNDSWTRGNPTINSYTKQGFTGHEQLDSHKLVHMQGRVYDPALGRFLSADPYIQSPYSTQSYNRYSYVGNNPLSFTDPTGYVSEPGYSGRRGPDDVEKTGSLEELRHAEQAAGLAQNYLQDLINGRLGFQIGPNTFVLPTSDGQLHKVQIDEKKSKELGVDSGKEAGFTDPHEDILTSGSTFFAAAGWGIAGNKYFLGKDFKYKPILPITHEKMLLDNLGTKLHASNSLKYGSNALGVVGYGLTSVSYTESMIKGDSRNARKYGIDGFYGALMLWWPVGTLVGGLGLYVNNDYHSDPNNP